MSESYKDGYEIIGNVLGQPSGFLDLLSRLLPHVFEYGKKRIGKHENPECATVYTEYHVETFFWSLGLISFEWILEDLRRKTKEGHCHTHKEKTGRPCPKGSAFHGQLYELCKKSFTEVIEAHKLL